MIKINDINQACRMSYDSTKLRDSVVGGYRSDDRIHVERGRDYFLNDSFEVNPFRVM